MFWFTTREAFRTDERVVKDWLRFPELRWLERLDFVAPLLLAALMYGLGSYLQAYKPELGVTGSQLLAWGFLISTVAVYHVTYSINSLAHRFGRVRYETRDDSRNNFLLALLTFGEGWHNNHHYYQSSARQGFYWWEIDITYYLLVMLSWVGLVWDLRPVPARVLSEGRGT